MNNQYYRNFTIMVGIAIIILAFLRFFGAFTPSILVLFCISIAALLYSLVDLLLEIKKDLSKKIILTLDVVAITFLILSFTTEGMRKLFNIEKLTVPAEVTTLFAFGVVILTIGIKDRKTIFNTIESMKSRLYIERKNKFSTLDSKVARQSMKDLARYEYNTVFHLNKIIMELKKCDSYVQQSATIHDGWSTLNDSFEYYRITREGPFYDHGINTLFWEFDNHLTSASQFFSNLSQPEKTIKIADVVIMGESFSIHRYLRIRSSESEEEYGQGYQHISEALIKWQELKAVATDKYELLGTIEQLTD